MLEIILVAMLFLLTFLAGRLVGAVMYRRRLMKILTNADMIRQAIEDITMPKQREGDWLDSESVPGLQDYVEKDVKETVTLFDSSSREEQLKDNLYRLHRHDKPESPFDHD